MQKFKFPLALPVGRSLTLTQPFGRTENTLEPVGPNGEPHFHYGIDVVDGSGAEMFGTPIVCPLTNPVLTAYMLPPGTPNATPFIELSGKGASGNHYKIVLAHMAAAFFRGTYNEGDVVALVGNRGLVNPPPTPQDPYAGTHLHLGLQVNGVWSDPFEYFDIATPYDMAGTDTDSGQPRLVYAISMLKSQLTDLQANSNG